MPKRWIIGGIWAVLMSAGMLTCIRNTAAEQPTKPGKIIVPSTPRSDAPLAAGFEQPTKLGKIIISEVIITGNQRVSTEEIKTHLRTQPNREYNPAVVDEDVRELYKTDQFSNITIWLNPDGVDRAKIYFGIREMPNMVQKVTYLGTKHIKQDELQNITGVRPNTPLNPNLNRQGCQKILEHYAEMGRSFAECQLIKGGDVADTEVIYQITEGPKVKVRDIRITGNTFISSARLMTRLKSSPDWFHLPDSTYNREKSEVEVGEIKKFFRSFGFLDVKVSLETQRSTDGKEVTLTFHIQEGKRYRHQDVPEVHGSREIPRKQLIALSAFKPGDYLAREKINTDHIITGYMRQTSPVVRHPSPQP